MKTLKINFTIETLEDFHIGTGLDCIGLYDDGQLKDRNGNPHIPAETLKGLLKQSCNEVIKIKHMYKSVYEEIFSFKNISSLDLLVDYEHKNEFNPFVIHTFTAIDETTGKGKSGSLRDIEFGSKGCNFEVNLLFDIKNIDKAAEIKSFLELGIKNLKWIGGSRRRGFGKVNCSINKSEFISFQPVHIDNTGYLKILFELEDDVCIGGAGYTGNHIQTLKYFNATTVLGMLRNVLIKKEDDSKKMSFLDGGKVRLSNFYPVNTAEIDDITVIPAPLSLRKNKQIYSYDNYFKDNVINKIPHWAIEMKPENGKKEDFLNYVSQDMLIVDNDKDTDGASDKSISDEFVVFKGNLFDPEKAELYKPKSGLLMRNNIDDDTQMTLDNGVFTQEILLKENMFLGEISFKNPDDMQSFIEVFNEYLSGERFLHIGRGAKPLSIKAYSNKKAANTVSEFAQNKSYISLTLKSDTILYNEKLMPKLTITPEDLGLEDYLVLKNDISASSISQAFTGLAGMRRFTDYAISKGSCFLYEFKAGKNFNEIKDRLIHLQENRIGFKKSEGFGEIIFNLSLHQFKKSQTARFKQRVEKASLPKYQENILEQNQKLFSEAEQLKSNNKYSFEKTFINKIISLMEAKTNKSKIDDLIKYNIEKNTKSKDDWQAFKDNFWNSNKDNDTVYELIKVAFLKLKK